MAAEYRKVTTVDELRSAGGKLCCEIDDHYIVVVEWDGAFYCIDDVCTHDGGPLGEGDLRNGCLSCPRHGAEFDVKTGNAVSMPATEPTTAHSVRVCSDGSIEVSLNH